MKPHNRENYCEFSNVAVLRHRHTHTHTHTHTHGCTHTHTHTHTRTHTHTGAHTHTHACTHTYTGAHTHTHTHTHMHKAKEESWYLGCVCDALYPIPPHRLSDVLYEAVEQSSDAVQITGPDSNIMVSLTTMYRMYLYLYIILYIRLPMITFEHAPCITCNMYSTLYHKSCFSE